MDINLKSYLGYSFDELQEILNMNELSYQVIEVWDRKKTKLGNDLRVVNIKTSPSIEIYVAYF